MAHKTTWVLLDCLCLVIRTATVTLVLRLAPAALLLTARLPAVVLLSCRLPFWRGPGFRRRGDDPLCVLSCFEIALFTCALLLVGFLIKFHRFSK